MKRLLAAWRVPIIVVGISGVALTVVSYAFAAANTVPATKAGDGAGAITGFTISNVVYTLNAANPPDLDQVAFDLDSIPPVGSNLRIKLVSAGATWYVCVNVGAAVTCDTTAPQATTLAADELRVVIAQ